jgi:hypothetical protein
MKFITELCENFKQGIIPIPPENLDLWKKHKKNIDRLTNCETSLCDKKKIVQKGGFISALLPILGSALVTHLLSKI